MYKRQLLQRAKNINFVYNSLTDESNTGEVSRILKQLEYESAFDFNYASLNLNVTTEPQEAVSYTHLDVYKRQVLSLVCLISQISILI